jgi:hypothetical protein
VLIFAGLAVAALPSGCTRPTHDRATLAAIRTESLTLMQAHPTNMNNLLPKEDWPRVIASLQPTFVDVGQEGVDIIMKPGFDGGYGYFVPKIGQELPGPPKGYSKLDNGIYWYRSY